MNSARWFARRVISTTVTSMRSRISAREPIRDLAHCTALSVTLTPKSLG